MNAPQRNPHLHVELCTGGIDDVQLAAELQVDRIELNCGMAVGGLTPPAGLVAAARRIFSGPIIAMVRPREAGFAYSKAEFTQMLDDCEFLLASGMTGIAIGCLKPDGNIDIDRCTQLRRQFPTTTLVCHKAFDVTPDLQLASRQLIDCGFNRILTSGGCAAAIDGCREIRNLREACGSQIEFVVGGGVRARNLDAIVRESGCDQIHTAVRGVVGDSSTNGSDTLDFGNQRDEATSGYGAADRSQLCELMAVAANISVQRRLTETRR
jgi:copper homeostasis protein